MNDEQLEFQYMAACKAVGSNISIIVEYLQKQLSKDVLKGSVENFETIKTKYNYLTELELTIKNNDQE